MTKRHQTIQQVIATHRGDIIKCIRLAVENEQNGMISRVFNETAYRQKALHLATTFVRATSTLNTPDPMAFNTSEQYDQALADLQENNDNFKHWHERVLHTIIAELFDKQGELKPSIKTILSPDLDQAYDKIGKDLVHKYFLQSYYTSFINATALEIHNNKIAEGIEKGDDKLSNQINCGSLLFQKYLIKLIFEKTLTVKELAQQVYEKKDKKIRQMIRWTQHCAQHVNDNPLRFCLASRQLHIAMVDSLPKSATNQDIENGYLNLSQSIPKITLTQASQRKISALTSGMKHFTSKSDDAQTESLNSKQGMDLFVRSNVSNFTASEGAQIDKKTQETVHAFCTHDHPNADLYKAWRADSHRKWKRRTFALKKVDAIIKKFAKFRKNHPTKLAAQLEMALLVSEALDKWIDMKMKKARLNSDSRVVAAIKELEEINTICQQLEYAVYSKELDQQDQKEEQTIKAYEHKTATTKRLSRCVIKMATTNTRKKSLSKLPHFFSTQRTATKYAQKKPAGDNYNKNTL